MITLGMVWVKNIIWNCTAKMKFTIKDFFGKYELWTNLLKTADMFTFNKEVLKGKCQFLCSDCSTLTEIFKIEALPRGMTGKCFKPSKCFCYKSRVAPAMFIPHVGTLADGDMKLGRRNIGFLRVQNFPWNNYLH